VKAGKFNRQDAKSAKGGRKDTVGYDMSGMERHERICCFLQTLYLLGVLGVLGFSPASWRFFRVPRRLGGSSLASAIVVGEFFGFTVSAKQGSCGNQFRCSCIPPSHSLSAPLRLCASPSPSGSEDLSLRPHGHFERPCTTTVRGRRASVFLRTHPAGPEARSPCADRGCEARGFQNRVTLRR
jgi:hypothetical protein